jgi:hypothetical protein
VAGNCILVPQLKQGASEQSAWTACVDDDKANASLVESLESRADRFAQ